MPTVDSPRLSCSQPILDPSNASATSAIGVERISNNTTCLVPNMSIVLEHTPKPFSKYLRPIFSRSWRFQTLGIQGLWLRDVESIRDSTNPFSEEEITRNPITTPKPLSPKPEPSPNLSVYCVVVYMSAPCNSGPRPLSGFRGFGVWVWGLGVQASRQSSRTLLLRKSPELHVRLVPVDFKLTTFRPTQRYRRLTET